MGLQEEKKKNLRRKPLLKKKIQMRFQNLNLKNSLGLITMGNQEIMFKF